MDAFWISVKSGLRQIYVSLIALALIGLLDLATRLDAPVGTRYAVVIAAALAIVKAFEKRIRLWVTGWIEDL